MSDERKTAAASYILTFYQRIGDLTNTYASYENAILELENKYSGFDIAKIDEQERATLLEIVQNVRYSCHLSYVMYKTICKSLDLKENKAINNSYKAIKKNMIISRSDLETFVIELNSMLITNIIKDLLDNSEKILNTVYNE